MKTLYYRLFLKLTGLPSRAQIRELRDTIFIYNGKRLSVFGQVLDLYIEGEPIDVIALELDITRERTKQFLLKAIR